MKKWTSILILLFAVVFGVSSFMLLLELHLQKKDKENLLQLAELVSSEPTPSDPTQQEDETCPVTAAPIVTRNLSPLFARNDDCVGWLFIAETNVDYPVMHTPDDPERYLHNNFDGQYSAAGVPFIDGNCNTQCDNVVIYGHNMKNGSMFAHITGYRDKAYRDAHPTVEFQTAAGTKQYSVFAVVQIKSNDIWYSTHHFQDETAYSTYMAELKAQALYDTGITPTYGTQLLTLSTCYDVGKTDRIVVICAEIPQLLT